VNADRLQDESRPEARNPMLHPAAAVEQRAH